MRATQSAWISLSHIEEATARYSCTHGYKSLYAPPVEVCLRVWCSRCSSRPLSLGFGYSQLVLESVSVENDLIAVRSKLQVDENPVVDSIWLL